ncbi:hypothetical protein [Mycobacteroides abscessus]|uniref:hypothetical protein n=1 Tax=Mycobacteroides abscessus TaxID=36809 RepID=UPI0002D7B44C|nr:hypothetical protein [Mycobacteroides abscessus]
MAEFVAAQAAVLMVPSIKGFHSKLKAALDTVRQDLTIQVKAQTKEMLAEIQAAKKAAEANAIDLRVKVHDKEYIKQITEIRHKYENLQSQFVKGLKLNVVVTGAQLIPQLAVAVAALNESIVSLSQNALLLPGVFSAAAASIGTLLLGTRGLKDAFTAYGEAQKSAVDDARRLRDAQRAVTDANRDYARALKDSQRNLRDLNLEMKGARLSEAEAILNVREAEEEARKAYGKSALDRQRDILRVQQAEQRLAEVRNRNADLAQDTAEANAKGVLGADNVASAIDRLTNANEKLKDSSKGNQGIATAMANLSPNARSFVAAVQELRGTYGGLRSDIQDRIFADLDHDVVALAGRSLPMLRRGLGGIGDAWNRNIRTLLSELGTGSNQGLVSRILGNTGEAQSRLSNAIRPFLNAFLQLGAVGSDVLPRLSTGFTQLMNRFDAFVRRSEESGKLDEWINRAIEAAKDFGNSLLNIGSIMNSLTEIFLDGGGKGFLQWFQEATKRTADYLKTAAGQERVNQFFRDARDVLREFRPLLSALPDLFRAAKDGAQLWASILLPFLNAAGTLLSRHPGLVTAAVTAYLGFRTVAPILKVINAGLDVMVARLNAQRIAAGQAALQTGAFNSRMTALNGMVGGAAGGVIGVGLAAVASILTYKYIQAQERAAGAVQDHVNSVNQLKAALDDVTGVMDKAGLAQLGKELTDYSSSGGAGQKLDHVNALQLAEKGGVDRGAYLNSFVGENSKLRGDTLKKMDDIVQNDLVANEWWQKYGHFFKEAGIPPDLIARALNGDQGAMREFEQKAKNGNPFTQTNTDLFQLQNKLGQQAHDASTAAGILRERTDTGLGVADDFRKTNEALNGKATLDQRGLDRFNAFGNPRASASPDGGMDIVVDRMPDAPFVANVRKNGGDVKETAGGGAQIHLPPDRARLYGAVTPPVRRAGGGMMSGPGSGTSDSILARLSNGEFVTKAASVAKYGPDLFHALNAGQIDPSLLPGFDEGGPVFVGPKNPYPYTPPSHVEAPSIPNAANPGLFDPATGTYSNAPTPAPAPAPSPNSPIDTARLTGGTSTHSGSGAAPGPDPSTILPEIPAYAPEIAQDIAPQGFGFGMINGLPDNIQPVNILAQIGEILLGAVLSFFGIDPTYFNLGKQAVQGVAKQMNLFGGGARDPQVDELLKPGALPSNVANKSPLSPENPIYDGLGSGSMQAIEFAQQHALGQKYVYGGVGNFDGKGVDGYDCSGIASALYAAATGKPQGTRYFTTESDFEKLGFIPGNKPGALNIGVMRGGGGPNSHMAVTLPNGVNVESGGSHNSTAYGGPARGASTFPLQWYLPLPENFATGGKIHGPGSGTSDSILARVSNGEFVTRAASVAKYGPDLFHALNEGRIDPSFLPGFDSGGIIDIPGLPTPTPDPQAQGPMEVSEPLPTPEPMVEAPGAAPAPSTVGGPTEGQQAPAPMPTELPAPDAGAAAQTEAATDSVGKAMTGIGGALKGVGGSVAPGAKGPTGASPEKDPRSVLGAAPKNQNHNAPAVQKGIEGAASAIGGALSTAISAAASAGSFGAAGPAAGAAGSMAAAGVQMAGQAVAGGVNVLSSLLVGTLTGGSTANASGTPMLPKEGAQPGQRGPMIQNVFNGGVHTSNLDQWNQNQQRREQQQVAAYQGTPVR